MNCLMATSVIGLGASYSRVYLFHLVLGFVLLQSVLRPARGTLLGGAPPQSRYHLFFPAMLTWFAAGLAWSQDRLFTLQYLGYVGVGTLLVLVIVKYVQASPSRFRRLFAVAQAFFLVDVAAGVLETLTPFRLPISLVSNSSFVVGDFADHSAEVVTYLSSCPTGFHWNPNNFAVVMILLLPFMVMHRSAMVWLAGPVVLGGLVVATSSRACVLAGVGVILLTQVFSRSSGWLIRLLVFLGIGMIGFTLLATQVNSVGGQKLLEASEAAHAVIDLFTSDADASQSSVGARQKLIRNGLKALIASKGLGIGGGADKALQQSAGVGDTELTAMHNVWIELLVGGGAPLFVLLVIWYVMLTWELFRLSRRASQRSPQRYYCTSFCLAMIGFVPAAVSASSTIYMLPMYLLFGFAIALVNVCRATEQAASPPSARPRAPRTGRPNRAPLPPPRPRRPCVSG